MDQEVVIAVGIPDAQQLPLYRVDEVLEAGVGRANLGL